MNDIRLIAIKYGRVMVPGIAILLVLGLIRTMSDATALVQIHAIAVMIISVFLSVFALDSLIRCIALADDRLMLLSPVSRWGLLVRSALTVGIYLLLGYMAASIPGWFADKARFDLQGIGLLGYACSVVCGLGLMAVMTFALNGMVGVTRVRVIGWTVFSVITALYAWVAVLVIKKMKGEANWVIGVSNSNDLVNVYAMAVPVSFLGLDRPIPIGCWAALFCLALGVVYWITAWAMSRRRQNYLGA